MFIHVFWVNGFWRFEVGTSVFIHRFRHSKKMYWRTVEVFLTLKMKALLRHHIPRDLEKILSTATEITSRLVIIIIIIITFHCYIIIIIIIITLLLRYSISIRYISAVDCYKPYVNVLSWSCSIPRDLCIKLTTDHLIIQVFGRRIWFVVESIGFAQKASYNFFYSRPPCVCQF